MHLLTHGTRRCSLHPCAAQGGIKPLADWLHARGFKIGIYTSASASACGGNWGSRGHETTDAQAFADWGVDWVKVSQLAANRGPATPF